MNCQLAVGMPLSREALKDAQALIREQLEAYKTQPLPAGWPAIGACAYWAKLRGEGQDGGKLPVSGPGRGPCRPGAGGGLLGP